MTKLITFTLIVLAIICSACGKSGPTGAQGAIGFAGAQGIQGVTGANGTSVTAVELCPGFVPSYPNIFVEFALCLQGKLYGVYSDHGGFLAELPPGAYSSDGINASCNLLIEANCVVERQ